jgi:ankyrin repeat protein
MAQSGQLTLMVRDKRLLTAVRQGNLFKVRELLEGGANPNSRDRTDRSALHLAVEQDNCQITEQLLGYGADINAQDTEGVACNPR